MLPHMPSGSPELDVISVVMRLEQAGRAPPGPMALMQYSRLRFASGYSGRSQPVVAADLPVPVQLHDPAKLAVGSRVVAVIRQAVRKLGPKVDMPLLAERPLQLLLAQGALQFREQVRQGLGVVPDMGAGAVAAAGGHKAAFPGPDVAVFLAQHGRRLEDRQIAADGIQHCRRQSGRIKRFFERERPGAKLRVMGLNITGDFAGIRPNAGIERTPQRGFGL